MEFHNSGKGNVLNKVNKYTPGKLVSEEKTFALHIKQAWYKVLSKKYWYLFEITTEFQQLTMETLFGRFPHLAEDIYGLLNGKTLSCCGQINNQWKESLKEYRFHLVKKIRKLLKNQNIMYGPVEDSDKEEHQTSYKNPIETLSIFTWSTGIKEHPVALERNITVEQLPRSDLIKILNYFCDYDGVFFLSLFSSYITAFLEPEPEPD